MKNCSSFLILMLFGFFSTAAQNEVLKKINLEEGPLKEVVTDYIASQKKQSPDVVGYFEIEQTYYNNKATGSERKVQYLIKKQNFMPNLSSSRFPTFYSHLNKDMLLYYFPNLPFQDLSLENKKRLIEELEPFLSSKEHIVGRNEKEEVVIDDPNFREEFYTIHGGILLKILANGEYLVEKLNP